jgi:hypothetical protein
MGIEAACEEGASNVAGWMGGCLWRPLLVLVAVVVGDVEKK